MPSIKFAQRVFANLPVPKGKRATYRDAEVHGLGPFDSASAEHCTN